MQEERKQNLRRWLQRLAIRYCQGRLFPPTIHTKSASYASWMKKKWSHHEINQSNQICFMQKVQLATNSANIKIGCSWICSGYITVIVILRMIACTTCSVHDMRLSVLYTSSLVLIVAHSWYCSICFLVFLSFCRFFDE